MIVSNTLELTHPRNRRAALAAGLLVDLTDLAHSLDYDRRVAISAKLHAWYEEAKELGDSGDTPYCLSDLIYALRQSESKLTKQGLLFLNRPNDAWSVYDSVWDVIHLDDMNLLAWYGRNRIGQPCVTVARIDCD